MALSPEDVIAEQCAEAIAQFVGGEISSDIAGERIYNLAHPWLTRDLQAHFRLARREKEAEDIFNMFVVRVLRLASTTHRALSEKRNPPRHYLWTMASNVARDFLRRKKSDRAIIFEFDENLDSMTSSSPSAQEVASSRDVQRAIRHALCYLPPDLRSVATLALTFDSIPEIAGHLGLSATETRNRKNKADRLVRRLLREGVIQLQHAN